MANKQINKSTNQRVNVSTYQRINESTYQRINVSTYQRINAHEKWGEFKYCHTINKKSIAFLPI